MFLSGILLITFLFNCIGPLPTAQAQEFVLPQPGAMVALSPAFNPPILKGIKVHPDNPFRFDFILDVGDGSKPSPKGRVWNPPLQEESIKLIKYFLASLTIPENDLWVNLSPYEKNRIIPQSFGQTEMGRDLLAEDYMLKQITASLIYPEGDVGKRFWKRIYEEAAKKFGTTNIPVDTFNKVWIVPEKAVVYENVQAGTAYIVESKLKVMLEEDYLALSHNVIPAKAGIQEIGDSPQFRTQKGTVPMSSFNKGLSPFEPLNVNTLGSQIIRQIVIPELTKEVNEDKNFAQLRQVYNSLILATWYKKKIKDSILEQVYANQKKVAGVNINDPKETQRIYQRYLQAFKKGVYNYIKEDVDPLTQETIPRKYFSGGVQLSDLAMKTNNVMQYTTQEPDSVDNAMEVTVDMAMSDTGGKKSDMEKEFNRYIIGTGFNEPQHFLGPLISSPELTTALLHVLKGVGLQKRKAKEALGELLKYSNEDLKRAIPSTLLADVHVHGIARLWDEKNTTMGMQEKLTQTLERMQPMGGIWDTRDLINFLYNYVDDGLFNDTQRNLIYRQIQSFFDRFTAFYQQRLQSKHPNKKFFKVYRGVVGKIYPPGTKPFQLEDPAYFSFDEEGARSYGGHSGQLITIEVPLANVLYYGPDTGRPPEEEMVVKEGNYTAVIEDMAMAGGGGEETQGKKEVSNQGKMITFSFASLEDGLEGQIKVLWRKYFSIANSNEINFALRNHTIYVARDESLAEKPVVGFIHFDVTGTGLERKFIYISVLAVASEFQGKGIGANLIDSVLQYGYNNGITEFKGQLAEVNLRKYYDAYFYKRKSFMDITWEGYRFQGRIKEQLRAHGKMIIDNTTGGKRGEEAPKVDGAMMSQQEFNDAFTKYLAEAREMLTHTDQSLLPLNPQRIKEFNSNSRDPQRMTDFLNGKFTIAEMTKNIVDVKDRAFTEALYCVWYLQARDGFSSEDSRRLILELRNDLAMNTEFYLTPQDKELLEEGEKLIWQMVGSYQNKPPILSSSYYYAFFNGLANGFNSLIGFLETAGSGQIAVKEEDLMKEFQGIENALSILDDERYRNAWLIWAKESLAGFKPMEGQEWLENARNSLSDFKNLYQTKSPRLRKIIDTIYKDFPHRKGMKTPPQTVISIPYILRDFPNLDDAKAVSKSMDKAMDGNGGSTERTGGIDLTPANMNVQVRTGSPTKAFGDDKEGIKFHMDAAMLERLQNAPGFVPVIISIQPMTNLRRFLGMDS